MTMAVDIDEARVSEEVRFIKQEAGWPMWPILPVKHVNRHDEGHPEDEGVGIMLSGRGTKIFLVSLDSLRPGLVEPQSQDARVLEFDSVEDLVRAGWVVD